MITYKPLKDPKMQNDWVMKYLRSYRDIRQNLSVEERSNEERCKEKQPVEPKYTHHLCLCLFWPGHACLPVEPVFIDDMIATSSNGRTYKD